MNNKSKKIYGYLKSEIENLKADQYALISDENIQALVDDAERIMMVSYLKNKQVNSRPSEARRKLKRLALALKSCEGHIDKLDDTCINILEASFEGNRISDDLFPKHETLIYFQRLSRLAEKASQLSEGHALSMGDVKRGRWENESLRTFITQMLLSYKTHLAIEPTLTMNPIEGVGDSLFYRFANKTLEVYLDQSKIDIPSEANLYEYIRKALPSRDFEYFTPPKI